MIRVENVNGDFIENITLEHYQSDEYLQRLYLDCMVDIYDKQNQIVKLYTHEEFKTHKKEIKKTIGKSKEELKKIQNERSKIYYEKNREKLNKYYREYRAKKKLSTQKCQEINETIDKNEINDYHGK
jgi:hypothetical protein